jgi:KDO2-lipid IV(A) lauroyltransferase
VLPALTVMEKGGSYKTAVGSIIEMEFSDNKDSDIYVNLKKIVRVFEQYIRKYPDQWYNFTSIWNKNNIQGKRHG